MTTHSASDTDRYAAVRLALGEPNNLDTDEEILTRCILADLDTANARADEAEAMCEWLADKIIGMGAKITHVELLAAAREAVQHE